MADTIGLSGDDALTGTSGTDKLIGGAGDDTLDGSDGSDFLNAGGGDDTLIFDEEDYKIIGGGGIDTLKFTGSGQTLNLGTHVVSGIEKLWLDGGGGHHVWLTAADIVRVSDMDQMIITGNASNRIHPDAGWSFSGLTADGQSQILTNGLAKMIVELPVFVEGFSGNAIFTMNGPTTMTEDTDPTTLSAQGQIIVTDPNAGQGLLLEYNFGDIPSVGKLTVTLDQPWSPSQPATYNYRYQVSNDIVQILGQGDTLVENFLIKTIDGTSRQLLFTTVGINDPAAIGDPTNTSVTEDLNPVAGILKVTGTISITDVDDGEAAFSAAVTAADGTLGTLTLAADGSYTYSVSNTNVQYLKAGAQKQENFTITSVDGTSKILTFTINGSSDPAVIGNPTNTSVTEDLNPVDGFLKAAGTISITDADHDDAAFNTSVTAAAGTLGTLSLTADGSYTYSVSNTNVQYLNTGEQKQESFTITSVDGTSKTLTFSVNGVNDVIVGSSGDDKLFGTSGDDTIYGGGGYDRIEAGDGNDTIYMWAPNDKSFSHASDGLVEGGNGDDTIYFYGIPSDIAYSGIGAYGREGRDTFVLTAIYSDTALRTSIRDFDVRFDKIDLPDNVTNISINLRTPTYAIIEGQVDGQASSALLQLLAVSGNVSFTVDNVTDCIF